MGQHHEVVVFAELVNADDRGDFFLSGDRQHLHQRVALRSPRTLWNLVGPQGVGNSSICKEENVVVATAGDEVLNAIVVFHLGARLASSGPVLRLEGVDQHALYVALLCHQNCHLLIGNQRNVGEVIFISFDDGSSLIGKRALQLKYLFFDDG